MSYIQVVEADGDEPIELPTEPDGTLLLTTVSAQFPGACGLKYRNAETGNLRGLRIQDGRLHSPEETWGSHLYYVVFPKETRKKTDESDSSSVTAAVAAAAKLSKPATVVERKSSDLIVLGLPYTCEKDEMMTYFSQFGEVLMAEVKKDVRTGKSKGFGFVRFADYDVQNRVLGQRHQISGRWCDVKQPLPKDGSGAVGCRKIFIGRCAEHITEQDLREYFGKYGEVTDVFIPRPFRGFAFVSFADPYVAPSICGEDHIIKGSSVHVTTAEPKRPEKRPYYADDYGPPPRGRGDRSDYYDNYGGGDGYSRRPREDHGWDHPSSSQARGSDVGNNINNPLAAMGLNLSSFAMNPAMLAAAAMASQNLTNMLMQTAQQTSAASAASSLPGAQAQAAQLIPQQQQQQVQQPQSSAIAPVQSGAMQSSYNTGNPGAYGAASQGSYSAGGQSAYGTGNQGSYGAGGSQVGYGWPNTAQSMENGR